MPETAPRRRGGVAPDRRCCCWRWARALLWWLGRPKPVGVLTASVGRGTVEATVANTRAGTVEACQRTQLSTIAGGRIEVLAVKEGDKVQARASC